MVDLSIVFCMFTNGTIEKKTHHQPIQLLYIKAIIKELALGTPRRAIQVTQ